MKGLLERDTGNIYLTPEAVDSSDEEPLNQLLGSAITYRIAVGPQQGRKVFMLQMLPDCGSDDPYLKIKNQARDYIKDFYSILDDPKRFQREVIDKCR
ncbi:MAG: hypothetical protein L3J24_09145 [Xanthomonadales bacterium]|nr:hypothetical protein [Xanthomonadales bacterium]